MSIRRQVAAACKCRFAGVSPCPQTPQREWLISHSRVCAQAGVPLSATFGTLEGVTDFPGQVRIDLEAIARNVATLVAAAPSSAVMAVVKADGYGHGARQAARAAVRGGASWLGVAQVSEAEFVRAGGVSVPLLAWLHSPSDDLSGAVAACIDVGVANVAELEQVAAAAAKAGARARVHVKVDTGLGRNGCAGDAWAQTVQTGLALQAAGRVELVGAWTHMAFADAPTHPSVTAQREAFAAALGEAAALGWEPEHQHLANSAATLTCPETHYTIVRPGIAVYGLSPIPGQASSAELGLVPAMTVRAQVALVKRVPAGQGVSYGLTYTCERDTSLALVPMGYADGVPRAASNAGPVSLGGKRFTVAGRVCMDQMMVDVGDAPVVAGDWVELLGTGEAGGPTAQDWADAAGTINYEIVTRMGPRVPRVYVGGEAGEGDA